MFYYLYQVTNTINNKIYAGVHKTVDLDDGYMGSGIAIKAAIKKYGIENFTKEILAFFDNSADMFAAEKELVTDEFLLREDTYNIQRGGHGGFDYLIQTGRAYRGGVQSEQGRAKIRAGLAAHYGKDDNRARKSEKQRVMMLENPPMHNPDIVAKVAAALTGKTKSASHKEKISAAMTGQKRTLITCPHCGKEGGENAMHRWHFSNCKNNRTVV